MALPKPLLLVIITTMSSIAIAIACSNGQCKLLDECSSDGDCAAGLYCSSCSFEFSGSRCIRSTASNPFALVNNSLPFNKYAFLTTHNSFAIKGEPTHTGFPRFTFDNQEDTVTQQLNNGVRALMLDTYEFKGGIWLCHSFKGKCHRFTAFNGVRALMLDTYEFKGGIWLCHSFKGKCHRFTAFEPLLDTLQEIEAFLSSNPTEIVTLMLEDYVDTPNALKNVFVSAGLLKYWFPVSAMPRGGQDWPLVRDMVTNNHRLLVFTSKKWKEDEEGIAYQWNYMVENQYGDKGMGDTCSNRDESSPLNDTSKSLVLVNYFRTVPIGFVESFYTTRNSTNGDDDGAMDATILSVFGKDSCKDNSKPLADMLVTCRNAAAGRWANFVAVDYYKRSGGGGAFQATDTLNGELICGSNDVHACKGS